LITELIHTGKGQKKIVKQREKSDMTVPGNTIEKKKERRKGHGDRRGAERRLYTERRYDNRENGRKHNNRSFYGWLRSLVKLRLGVDRRKNNNQRKISSDRRRPSSLLTKDELTDLLK